MEVHIFDVEHGSCKVVIAPSGEVILIDCGHNASTDWRPSYWLYRKGLEVTNLTVANMDEDHVSDLPYLRRLCRIHSLSKNWHITPDWIRRAKAEQGMGPGVEALVSMMEEYTGPSLQTDWGGLEIGRFCHPPSVFDDENSLSLVTFVHSGGVKIVFPGDLTRQAWKELLKDTTFRTWLRDTNIFVASHHGRKDGYCPEVFDYCTPSAIVISDMGIKYDTQQVDYSQHALGIRWNQTETKKVLTTRKNGKLTIGEMNGSFHVTAQR